MKTAIRRLSVFALLAALSSATHAAQVFSYTSASAADGLIPDASGDPEFGGFVPGEKEIQFSISGVESLITDLKVTLNIQGYYEGAYSDGGYNGDLFISLKKLNAGGDVTSVLVNRVADGGSNQAGFDVTLVMGSDPDIHLYKTITPDKITDTQLTGTWAADGRTNPGAGLSTDARPATLDVFKNVNPNGNWVLYLADYSNGASMALNSFSLDMTTVAVPEPAQMAMAVGGMLFGLALYRKPGIRNAIGSWIRK